jgi:hypothetical protein
MNLQSVVNIKGSVYPVVNQTRKLIAFQSRYNGLATLWLKSSVVVFRSRWTNKIEKVKV